MHWSLSLLVACCGAVVARVLPSICSSCWRLVVKGTKHGKLLRHTVEHGGNTVQLIQVFCVLQLINCTLSKRNMQRNMSGAEAGVSLHQTHVKLELLELPCLAGAGTSMVDTAHTFHISRYSCTSLNCIQSEVHAVTVDHARLKCSTIHRLRPCAL